MAMPPISDVLLHDAVGALRKHSTKREAAESLGLKSSTYISRLQEAKRRGILAGEDPTPTRNTPLSSDEHIKIRGLKDENARLKKELIAAQRTSLFEEQALLIMRGMAEVPVAPPVWLAKPAVSAKHKRAQEVPVTMWSDWHYTEVVNPSETTNYNAYNVEIANKRINKLVDNTIDLCRERHSNVYPGIVLNLAGDNMSGGLHPELMKSDEQSPIRAVLSVRDILVDKIERLADEFKRVFIPAVPGNHGRNTHRPEFKGYVGTNFDWMVYQLLLRHFAKDKRIQMLIPDSGDAYYTVYGKRILLTHGDMLGVKGGDGIIGAIGPIMRGAVKVRSQSSALGQPYDLLLMGHWHQTLWLPNAFVNNSLKGFDEYAAKSLRALPSEPSQMLFFVHPTRGVTSKMEVYVDEPRNPSSEEWLAWKS